jgi:hypothetical protein
MNNNNTYELNSIIFRKSNPISADDYDRDYKFLYVNKFKQAHLNNPNIRKRDLCNQIGISESTLNRFMKDLGLNSLYRTKRNLKVDDFNKKMN